MQYVIHGANRSDINLQATLSAASAMPDTVILPHHPIQCNSEELTLDPDTMTMSCPHASTEPHDARTQHCVNHTVALLLIELAMRRF